MKRALLVLVFAVALVVVPLGAAEISYSDPAGDSGSGPDITTVTVSNTDTGVVTVRIAVSLEPSSLVGMAIDADRNSLTGDELGLEGMIGVMKVLEQAAGGSKQPEFLSTHPSPTRRIDRIAEMIEAYRRGN